MARALLGGTTFEYEDEGEGSPLVLIHGHPFDRSMWRPQVESFSAAGWRVIAPDLRGYGGSDVVTDAVTLDVFARDIATLLDHLDIAEVVLVGLSMGGQIAMEFHRLWPARVRGLVLADTVAVAETEEGKSFRNATADRLLRDGMARYANELLPTMLAARTMRHHPPVARHVLGMMRATSTQGAASALRGRAQRPDYVESLCHAVVPTLVVVGDEDELTPIPDAQVIADVIPDATLEIIHEAAHLPNLERPAEFNAVLGRFLDSLPSAAATKR